MRCGQNPVAACTWSPTGSKPNFSRSATKFSFPVQSSIFSPTSNSPHKPRLKTTHSNSLHQIGLSATVLATPPNNDPQPMMVHHVQVQPCVGPWVSLTVLFRKPSPIVRVRSAEFPHPVCHRRVTGFGLFRWGREHARPRVGGCLAVEESSNVVVLPHNASA